MEDTWVIILTTVVPPILAIVAVAFSYFKNKEEIKKIRAETLKLGKEASKAEGDTQAVSGDIFLKWTKEFKARLEWVEEINKKLTEKAEEQDKLLHTQNTTIEKYEFRISVLEEENEDFKKVIEELRIENSLLRCRVGELEEENRKLRAARLQNGTNGTNA